MRNFLNLLRDEAGASAAEYALILAVVGVGIIISALALGGAIGNSMNCAATTIDEKDVGSGCTAATPAP